jgi:hypothetical protein
MTEFHIISRGHKGQKWALKKRGARKAIKLFNDQQKAIDYTRCIPKYECIKIYVHKTDGTLDQVIIQPWFVKPIDGILFAYQTFAFNWEITEKTFIGTEFIGFKPEETFFDIESMCEMMSDSVNKDGFMPELVKNITGLIGEGNYIYNGYALRFDDFVLFFYIKENVYKDKLKLIDGWKKYNNFDTLMRYTENKLDSCPCH